MSMSIEMLVNQYINDGWNYYDLKKQIREKWAEGCRTEATKYLKKCRARGDFK